MLHRSTISALIILAGLLSARKVRSLTSVLQPSTTRNLNVRRRAHLHNHRLEVTRESSCEELDENDLLVDRRTALSVALAVLTIPQASFASTEEAISDVSSLPDVHALSDLPPLEPGYVRLYLCRHGQTENNRLNLLQGSRVNSPINRVGMAQATQLGKALQYASPPPEIIFHSPLIRARMTAEVASQQFSEIPPPPPVKPLATLGEIDFGAVSEGLPLDEVRYKMVAAYAAWASGEVNTRMDETGENLSEILSRVEKAIWSLAQAAEGCESRCIAAVAHSTYLRIVLLVLQELPLAQFASLKQVNTCVNVIDIKMNGAHRKIGPKSNLFGGLFVSRAPMTFSLEVPMCKIVRINEKRHLGNLV